MIKILKGNFVFTKEMNRFEVYENGYVVVENGKIKLLTKELPEIYQDTAVEDMGDQLIIPGFVDLHVHAPQWLNTGIGYSKELLPWLNDYTFPLESEFDNVEFAKEHYENFIQDLWEAGTTRACVFATRHKDATSLLIKLLKESGLGAYVGKVNMDRNSSPRLQETTEQSIQETIELLEEDPTLYEAFAKDNTTEAPLVQYILTPRFVPSTTAALMKALGEIAVKYNLPIQSHLSENRSEVAWVKELHPDIDSFAEVYEHFGLIQPGRTIMAHCVYNTDSEIELLRKNQVYVAHCPQSNFNLASGIMPLRKYLNLNVPVGLGSDVGGGHVLDMSKHIVDCITASKMYFVDHPDYAPISVSEAFYLATKGGGSFFGKVGSFEEGYDFDALVINDSSLKMNGTPTLVERLEKFIYNGSSQNIAKRFVRGTEIKR
ncbi:MAG: amidohydrolase family protein [Anaerocolumna aminovalerica]|jgi:guanine deaminase|uniref:amidohydrolase family protein n=1 Tax=Anaerocolumna aminovalerica TaxID=1527 RepID=UPI001C0EF35E|nr:amidohydrolase family protein [Anaerocolumna aminovalerica]MBU5332017.1 amidohydrolase family protein [Anaerocolumna aminovalerica]MDU6265081.1 amidohydrolase family protein [Anaerocolumna aminovalerica]